MRPINCVETSSTNYQVTRRSQAQKMLVRERERERDRVLLKESKNCKMQDITVFCSDSFSDPHRYVRSIL
jgi:hypothetical protein